MNEGLDGAMGFEKCVVADEGAFRAIFLIGKWETASAERRREQGPS